MDAHSFCFCPPPLLPPFGCVFSLYTLHGSVRIFIELIVCIIFVFTLHSFLPLSTVFPPTVIVLFFSTCTLLVLVFFFQLSQCVSFFFLSIHSRLVLIGSRFAHVMLQLSLF